MARRHARCASPRPVRSRSRPRSEGPRGDAGFTLVEVLVAVVVLTVGLVSLAQLLAVSVRMHQLSRNTEVATQLAEQKFEELMKLNFVTEAAVQVTPNGADTLNTDVTDYFDLPENAPFSRRWLVENGPVDRTRRVTVRVVPLQAGLMGYRTVQLTTIIRQW
jgi:prepilin-type N-terminal cleavage/methylation domain-containing protein